MRLMRRPFGLLAGLVLSLFGCWLLVGSAQAQTSGSSSPSDLGSLFQGLSPDQQQAILSRLGAGNLGGGTTALTGLQGGGGATGMPNQAMQQQTRQQMSVRGLREQEKQKPLIPLLEGGDWVIIQAGFHLPPPPSNPQAAEALQQLYSQGGAPSVQSLQQLQALQALQANQSGRTSAALTQAQTPPSAAPLSDADKERLTKLIKLIGSRNPYQLSSDGELTLPGFAPIPLLGLTEQQATLRLQVVPAFQDFEVRLTLLPLKKTGEQALKPFGYDLFAEYPASFEPLTNVPVPSNYIVGPGDMLDVLVYGNQNHAYQMAVAPDGRINFPQLGPINVGGQLFSAVQAEIEARVSHQMIGDGAEPLDPGLRDGKRVRAGGVHHQRFGDRHLGALCRRRDPQSGILAEHRVEAKWRDGAKAGSLRPADPWEHRQRCEPPSGRCRSGTARRPDSGD
jgi:polysaccharide export outer membrane protein